MPDAPNESMNQPAFDPAAMIKTLVFHDVRFVVIGGFAARLQGSPRVTNDVDICYARDRENLSRLASALLDMGAKLRGVEEETPFAIEAESMVRGDHFAFSTRFGALDCRGVPAGIESFEPLDAAAVEMNVDDFAVRVASLDDLIRMKRASGRSRDRAELEILGALREEIDQEDGSEV